MSANIEADKERFLNYKKTMLDTINREININTDRYLSSMRKNISTKLEKDETISEEVKDNVLELFSEELTLIEAKLNKDSQTIIQDQLMTYDNKMLHMFYNVKRKAEQEAEIQLHDIINTEIKHKQKLSYQSNSSDEDNDDDDDDNGLVLNSNIDNFISRFNISNIENIGLNYGNVIDVDEEIDFEELTSQREGELNQKNVTEIRSIASKLGITIKASGKTKNKSELIEEIIITE